MEMTRLSELDATILTVSYKILLSCSRPQDSIDEILHRVMDLVERLGNSPLLIPVLKFLRKTIKPSDTPQAATLKR